MSSTCIPEKAQIILLIFVQILCLLVGIFGAIAVSQPWIKYDVPDSVRENATNTSDVQLFQLGCRYPAVLFSRIVYMQKVCYPGMNDDNWLKWFGRKPTFKCRKDDNYQTVCTKNAYCTSVDLMQTQISNDTQLEPQDSFYLTVQPRLLTAAFAVYIVAIIFSVLVMFNCCAYARPLRTICLAGVSAFHILKAGLIAMVLVCFYSIEDMDVKLKHAPHYGFIQSHEVLSVTKKTYTHGLALTWTAAVFQFIELSFLAIVLMTGLWEKLLVQCRTCCQEDDDDDEEEGGGKAGDKKTKQESKPAANGGQKAGGILPKSVIYHVS